MDGLDSAIFVYMAAAPPPIHRRPPDCPLPNSVTRLVGWRVGEQALIAPHDLLWKIVGYLDKGIGQSRFLS